MRPEQSLRRLTRKTHLKELVRQFGVTTLAGMVRTPKSHISAMASGARGIGDELAARLEAATGNPPGWMDRPVELANPDPGSAYLAVIRQLNPETFETILRQLQTIAQGLQETDRLLRANHGIKGYVSPKDAERALPKPPAQSHGEDRPQRISGLGGLDDLTKPT